MHAQRDSVMGNHPSVCASVCPPNAGTVSKRMDVFRCLVT